MRSDEGNSDSLGRLSLLASAISSRALQVAPGEPGEPAWTDGRVVFVDASISTREQVEAVAVQASLLAAGSLDTDVVRRLTRRPALARRYLAVEGHRALAAIEDLLPPSVRSLIDSDVAARVDSPAASLTAALSRTAIADPPDSFGAIRARHLLKSIDRADSSSTTRQHVPREQRNRVLAELAEDEDDDGTAADLFSSPVGGGGALGRLLGQLLGVVRQLNGGGPPGADAPTHRTRAGTRGGRNAAFSTGMEGTVEEAAIERRGTKYPEWDVHRRRYRQDWCTVQEVEPRPKDSTPLLVSGGYGLRRPLARLGMGLDRCHRRVQGDDIDIDAVVEARVEAMAGSAPDEAIYVEQPSPPARSRRAPPPRHLGLRGRTRCDGPNGARATAGGGRRAHCCSSRSRRSRGALRLPLAGAVRRAPGAGEAVRRRSRHPRDAASARPRARRVLEAGCGDPTWRGRVGETGRDVAAVARRAVRWVGVRPRL